MNHRLRSWPVEDSPPVLVSLESYRRSTREEGRRDAYDDGTVVGFFLGVAAATLSWAIVSGALARIAFKVVYGAIYLLWSAPHGGAG